MTELMNGVMNEDLEALYQEASRARENSYSPYSGKKVGAAVLTSDGKIYGGCNVENSSYGITACAEQVAIQKAVSESGATKITQVLVLTDAEPAWPPCGLCRQVIAEFASGDVPIHAVNLMKNIKTQKLSDIFPNAFTPDHLKA